MDKIALHEKLELHEILTFKTNCLTKATTMKGLVGCEELKEILTIDEKENKQHIKQIDDILKNRSVPS